MQTDVGKVDARLIERLMERDKRASQTFQNKKGDVIAACCLEGVRLFQTTRNLLFRNLHG
jgi:hypothetical protein